MFFAGCSRKSQHASQAPAFTLRTFYTNPRLRRRQLHPGVLTFPGSGRLAVCPRSVASGRTYFRTNYIPAVQGCANEGILPAQHALKPGVFQKYTFLVCKTIGFRKMRGKSYRKKLPAKVGVWGGVKTGIQRSSRFRNRAGRFFVQISYRPFR